MKERFKKYRLFGLVLAVNLILAIPFPSVFRSSVANAGEFLLNILLFLPMVLVLMGLFDAWVPRRVVEQNIGPTSGVRGMGLAILLGTAAAGPVYAAFPLALSLWQKGARVANIAILLQTWAAIKIPMVLMESQFVGLDFALVRLALTVPAVILTGLVMERLLRSEPIPGPTAPGA